MKSTYFWLSFLLIIFSITPVYSRHYMSWLSSITKPFYERPKLTLAIGCACAGVVCAYGIYKYYYGTPDKKQGNSSKTQRTNKNSKKFESRPTDPMADTTPHGLLLQAAAQGDVALMKKILREHRSNAVLHKEGTLLLNAVDECTGQTLLHKAAMSGKVAACTFLLQFNKAFEKHGVGLNTKDKDGNTPLHCAVASWDQASEEIVKLLLEHGADACIQNNDGNTALHAAVEYSKYAAIRYLLGLSQNRKQLLEIRNNNHQTAELIARRNTDKDLLLPIFAAFKKFE